MKRKIKTSPTQFIQLETKETMSKISVAIGINFKSN